MKKKSLLLIGLCLLILPLFGLTGCGKKTLRPYQPRYLMAGDLVDTSSNPSADDRFNYYLIDGTDTYAVGLKESQKDSNGSITVPEDYDHDNNPETEAKAVIGIWRDGFQGSRYSSVTIKNNITTIDYEAFLDSAIETIVIPSSVSEIGDAAFYSCKRLTKVIFNNSSIDSSASSSACECIEPGMEQQQPVINENITYSQLKKIPSFCFFNCSLMRELLLPENLEEISYEAFNGCVALSSSLVFQSLKTIRSRAFQSCTNLKAVYISQSFFNSLNNGVIEPHAFNYCNDDLKFYFAGDAGVVSTWANANANWGLKSDLNNDKFTYIQTAGDVVYYDDWIYRLNGSDVKIIQYIGSTDSSIKFISFPDYLPANKPTQRVVEIDNGVFTASFKAQLQRVYLPKYLKKINNIMFSGYDNLIVVDINTACYGDNQQIQQSQAITPRIMLSELEDLEIIGDYAFLVMKKYDTITKVYLPCALKAVGTRVFGSQKVSASSVYNKAVNNGQTPIRIMKSVVDFKWYYDESKSQLEVIGHDAFFKIGCPDNKNDLPLTEHHQFIKPDGTHLYQNLTTLILPKTFKHTGFTQAEANAFGFEYGVEQNSGNGNRIPGEHAFSGSPLISKVIIKGSDKDYVNSHTQQEVDPDTSDLVLGLQTFCANESLRTIIIEERVGHSVLLHTQNGRWSQPCIGWSCGTGQNDFIGDPGLQTLILPNKKTILRLQSCAIMSNSRAAIYLTGDQSTNLFGHQTQDLYNVLKNPNSSSVGISNVSLWRTIGDESFHNAYSGKGYLGYCFATKADTQTNQFFNTFGLDQETPLYENIHYEETINENGITNVKTECGIGNTNCDLVVSGKYAFITNNTTHKATLSKYLYDRYDSRPSGNAKVPAIIQNYNGDDCTVNVIGQSAFSAAFSSDNKWFKLNNGVTGHEELTSVSVPDTIERIEEYAFMRAYGVRQLNSYNPSTNVSNGDYVMPSSLEYIGRHAFAFCNIEQFLQIPNNCIFYENTDEYDMTTATVTSAFSNNFSLRKITFGSTGSTESTNYSTTTYSRSQSETYTSALYSKATTKNPNCLLLILNRDSADETKTAEDFTQVTSGGATSYQFNGQFKTNPFLYGAYKMAYWMDSLIVGTPTRKIVGNNETVLEQPLFSGVYERKGSTAKDSYVYLNTPIRNYENNDCDLTTVSFGTSSSLNIQAGAFRGCSLTHIRFPRSVGAVLPDNLFASLESNMIIEVPTDETGTSFADCASGVIDLTYTGYAGIGSGTFQGTNYTKLIAPITSSGNTFTVGSGAFSGCTSMQELDFSNVAGNVVIENGAFTGCTALTKIDFTGVGGTIEIKESAFSGAKIGSPGIIWTTENNAEVRIGKLAFNNCNFTSHTLTLSSKTTLLGESCFSGCTSINTVTADGNLTSVTGIGKTAFYGCSNITSFDFAKFTALTTIGEGSFQNTGSLSSTGVVIPSTVTTISKDAFRGSHITSVKIDSSAISLGQEAFCSCSNLTSVYFSKPTCSLSFGNGVFNSCSSLTSIYLPSTFAMGNTLSNSIVSGDSNVTIYTYITIKNVGNNADGKWNEYSNQMYAPIVYFAGDSLDLANENNGVYTLSDGGASFWTIDNNTIVVLGHASSIDSSTGTITFDTGYTLAVDGTVGHI